MENNNFKRKIKNINEVILDNLIKKKYLHNIQRGGNINTTVELKKTQSHLLKTLKEIDNVKVPNASIFNNSFDELNNELQKINDKFLIMNSNKYVKSEAKSILNEFTNFDKVLNDISGGVIEMSYKNDHKITTPLTLKVDSLNKVDSLINEIGKLLDFKEREEKVSVNKIEKIDVKKLEPMKDFIERTEKINLAKFNELTPEQMKSLDNFEERKETVNLRNIKNLKTSNIPLDFEERKEQVDLKTFSKLTPVAPGNKIFDYTERKEKVDLKNILDLNPETSSSDINFDVKIYENKLRLSQEYVDKNYDKINAKIEKIVKEFDLLEQILTNIEARISYFKLEFNTKKIKDLIELIVIEDIEENDLEPIDGLDELIDIPKVSFTNKSIMVNNRKYPLDSDPIYTQPEFIETLYNQTAGNMDKYFYIAMKYNEILKRKGIIYKLKKAIEEYNVLYIQYYYYQFYMLNNVNKFYSGLPNNGGKLPIYQNLNYKTVESFWKILYRLNEVISEPISIFSDINSRERTVHSIFYFRYFIIIKILFEFFNSIKELWDKKNIDKNYKVNLFKYDLSKNNQQMKDLTRCIVIFNLSYNIFLNYGQVFMKKPDTI